MAAPVSNVPLPLPGSNGGPAQEQQVQAGGGGAQPFPPQMYGYNPNPYHPYMYGNVPYGAMRPAGVLGSSEGAPANGPYMYPMQPMAPYPFPYPGMPMPMGGGGGDFHATTTGQSTLRFPQSGEGEGGLPSQGQAQHQDASMFSGLLGEEHKKLMEKAHASKEAVAAKGPTTTAPSQQGVPAGLVSHGVVYPGASHGVMRMPYPYVMAGQQGMAYPHMAMGGRGFPGNPAHASAHWQGYMPSPPLQSHAFPVGTTPPSLTPQGGDVSSVSQASKTSHPAESNSEDDDFGEFSGVSVAVSEKKVDPPLTVQPRDFSAPLSLSFFGEEEPEPVLEVKAPVITQPSESTGVSTLLQQSHVSLPLANQPLPYNSNMPGQQQQTSNPIVPPLPSPSQNVSDSFDQGLDDDEFGEFSELHSSGTVSLPSNAPSFSGGNGNHNNSSSNVSGSHAWGAPNQSVVFREQHSSVSVEVKEVSPSSIWLGLHGLASIPAPETLSKTHSDTSTFLSHPSQTPPALPLQSFPKPALDSTHVSNVPSIVPLPLPPSAPPFPIPVSGPEKEDITTVPKVPAVEVDDMDDDWGDFADARAAAANALTPPPSLPPSLPPTLPQRGAGPLSLSLFGEEEVVLTDAPLKIEDAGRGEGLDDVEDRVDATKVTPAVQAMDTVGTEAVVGEERSDFVVGEGVEEQDEDDMFGDFADASAASSVYVSNSGERNSATVKDEASSVSSHLQSSWWEDSQPKADENSSGKKADNENQHNLTSGVPSEHEAGNFFADVLGNNHKVDTEEQQDSDFSRGFVGFPPVTNYFGSPVGESPLSLDTSSALVKDPVNDDDGNDDFGDFTSADASSFVKDVFSEKPDVVVLNADEMLLQSKEDSLLPPVLESEDKSVESLEESEGKLRVNEKIMMETDTPKDADNDGENFTFGAAEGTQVVDEADHELKLDPALEPSAGQGLSVNKPFPLSLFGEEEEGEKDTDNKGHLASVSNFTKSSSTDVETSAQKSNLLDIIASLYSQNKPPSGYSGDGKRHSDPGPLSEDDGLSKKRPQSAGNASEMHDFFGDLGRNSDSSKGASATELIPEERERESGAVFSPVYGLSLKSSVSENGRPPHDSGYGNFPENKKLSFASQDSGLYGLGFESNSESDASGRRRRGSSNSGFDAELMDVPWVMERVGEGRLSMKLMKAALTALVPTDDTRFEDGDGSVLRGTPKADGETDGEVHIMERSEHQGEDTMEEKELGSGNDAGVGEVVEGKAGLQEAVTVLIEEGRVREAYACKTHLAASNSLPALKAQYVAALEEAQLETAATIRADIQAAEAVLGTSEQVDRWQKRRAKKNSKGDAEETSIEGSGILGEGAVNFTGAQAEDRETSSETPIPEKHNFESTEQLGVSSRDGNGAHEALPYCPDRTNGRNLTIEDMLDLLGLQANDQRAIVFETQFSSADVITLAQTDLRAAVVQHARALYWFQILNSANASTQNQYIAAWASLARQCALLLEEAAEFSKRLHKEGQEKTILETSEGCDYLAGVGQIYGVFAVLAGTAQLHAMWLLGTGSVGTTLWTDLLRSSAAWEGGLEAWVTRGTQPLAESCTWREPWRAEEWAETAAIRAAVEMREGRLQAACGLCRLPLLTSHVVPAVEWDGCYYLLPLANLWANRVSRTPPKLPSTKPVPQK